MVDTVRLRSPHVSEALAYEVTQACQVRTGVDVATGEVLYEFTSGSLEGSWDTRVSVQVKRLKWVCPGGAPPAIQVDCAPYLEIEGSVHKALLGHNLFGGPEDPSASVRWFVADVARRLGVELPPVDLWELRRVDWAEVYDLGSWDAVQEYVHRLNSADYPRRKVTRYGCEALVSPGQTTSVKVYHKGPEFRQHDLRRWRRVDNEGAAGLLEQADRFLRFEVELHHRKLEADGVTQVDDLDRAYLEGVHDREAARLLREGQCEMEQVRTHREVKARLDAHYSQELAGRLFGTWLQFAALGEKVVKASMNRATFYRHRAQLTEVGVQWLGADVRVVAALSLVPEGFRPVRNDPRRVTGEHPSVTMALAAYRDAA